MPILVLRSIQRKQEIRFRAWSARFSFLLMNRGSKKGKEKFEEKEVDPCRLVCVFRSVCMFNNTSYKDYRILDRLRSARSASWP